MSELEQQPESGISRRTVTKAMAWAVPAVAVAAAVPIASASPLPPKCFSSWGTTDGSVSCKKCDGDEGKYAWNIDNTSGSGLGYHGVLFPGASVNQVYSNVINVYWLPFKTGTSTQNSGSVGSWSNLAYDASYGTVAGPGGVPYYAWVTTFAGPHTVVATDIDGNGVFHLTPDYKFSISATGCVAGGDLWVSHAYTYTLNGKRMSNCTGNCNNNYCGATAAYPNTGNTDTSWRNNGWVGPLASGCGNAKRQDVQQQSVTEESAPGPVMHI